MPAVFPILTGFVRGERSAGADFSNRAIGLTGFPHSLEASQMPATTSHMTPILFERFLTMWLSTTSNK